MGGAMDAEMKAAFDNLANVIVDQYQKLHAELAKVRVPRISTLRDEVHEFMVISRWARRAYVLKQRRAS
jgi:hypothetical protein